MKKAADNIETRVLIDTSVDHLRELMSREDTGTHQCLPHLVQALSYLLRVQKRVAFEAAKKAKETGV